MPLPEFRGGSCDISICIAGFRTRLGPEPTPGSTLFKIIHADARAYAPFVRQRKPGRDGGQRTARIPGDAVRISSCAWYYRFPEFLKATSPRCFSPGRNEQLADSRDI